MGNLLDRFIVKQNQAALKFLASKAAWFCTYYMS